MAEIHLSRKHSLGLKKAKAAAQKVADDMQQAFDMKSEWDGNVVHFTRSGVSGTMTVSKDGVSLDAKLGFLLSALKPRIEAKISEDFERYFS